MVRKALVVIAVVVAVATILLGVAAGGIWMLGSAVHDEYAAEAFVLERRGDALAGKRLAELLCVRCHYDPGTQSLAGRSLAAEYRAWGSVHASNITADPVWGIGQWSDEDLVMLLRSGVHPHRKVSLPPYMPHMPNIADVDLANLIAFLRSDDPWVAAQEVPDEPSVPAYAWTLRSWISAELGPSSAIETARPKGGDPVALGAYLANDLLQCHACHSARIEDVRWNEPKTTRGLYEGGMQLVDPSGNTVVAPNLTPSQAGLKAWDFGEFRAALAQGIAPGGHVLRWPMPRYAALSDDELAALFAYFRSLEPRDQAVGESEPYDVVPEVVDAGRHHFERLGCPSCHPSKGPGMLRLDDAPTRFPDDAGIAAYVADPYAVDGGAWMPGYGHLATPEQLLQIAEYVRRRVEQGPFAPPPKE